MQEALNDHEIVIIPASDFPYMIDNSVTIPSNRRIEANGATIRLKKDVHVLMLRNENTLNGTFSPLPKNNRDGNITITGGSWEESNTERLLLGHSGLYKEDEFESGVTCCMYFNNVNNLTLKDLSFAHTATFAIEIGDATNVHCKNIEFNECFADGLHVNGGVENLIARNLSGILKMI